MTLWARNLKKQQEEKQRSVDKNYDPDWYWSVLFNRQALYSELIQVWQFSKRRMPVLNRFTGTVSTVAEKFFPPISQPLDVELPWGTVASPETMRLPAHSPSNRTYMSGRYELDVVDKIQHLNLDGTVAIDIGAHAGYFSRLFANSGAIVMAFEPNPTSFQYLSSNMRGFEHVRLFESAVGGENRYAYLSDTSSLERGKITSQGTYSVRVVTLDSRVKENLHESYPISLIKIDVEGLEGEVLRGASETLKNNKGIGLIVEYSPKEDDRIGTHWDELRGILIEYGFKEYEALERHTTHKLSAPFPYLADNGIYNLYIQPREGEL